MEVGDLVRVVDKFNIFHFGVITGAIDMDDEILYVITFFDGSEAVIHPSRIEVLNESR